MGLERETVKLGAITQWLSGGTPSRSVSEYWDGDIPWISASTLQAIDVFDSDQYVTAEAVAFGSKMAPINATLLLVRGSALHNEIRAGIVCAPVCFNQDVKALIPSKRVYPRYLTYSILGRESELLKLVSSAGNTAGVLDTKLVQSFNIWLPGIEEQRAIAAALSDVDALLEGLDRLISKKRDLKQAAMQQLLTGQTRLPGFKGKWEMKLLGECLRARPDYGINAAAVTYSDRLPSYIRITDITEHGRFNPDPPVSVDSPFSEHYLLQDGDLVFARTGASVGKSYLYRISDGPLVFAGFLIRVRPNMKTLIPEYLAAYVTTKPYWNWVRLMSMRSGQPGINGSEYAELPLLLPQPEEQAAIATILSDMDAEIAALEQRRAKTADLKQAMMQELLTGRMRLIKPAGRNLKESKIAQPDERKANVYFIRSVLAAEIVDRLHEEPTFGHVKFEKMLFLAEHLCEVDTGSTYRRKAAGPYDNRALRSIDSQLRKQQWFDASKEGGRYRYVPMARRGGHKRYFEKYFSRIGAPLTEIIETFRTLDTERCEIVATLFAAWSDLLREKDTVSDEMIVHEVLNNWHESKQRIAEDRWLSALGWMREKGLVPKGVISL